MTVVIHLKTIVKVVKKLGLTQLMANKNNKILIPIVAVSEGLPASLNVLVGHPRTVVSFITENS